MCSMPDAELRNGLEKSSRQLVENATEYKMGLAQDAVWLFVYPRPRLGRNARMRVAQTQPASDDSGPSRGRGGLYLLGIGSE